MADNTPCRLLCVIAGESTPFRVQPTGSMDVIDLKVLIKEEGKSGVLLNVDAQDLTLWKVSLTMARDVTTNFPAG